MCVFSHRWVSALLSVVLLCFLGGCKSSEEAEGEARPSRASGTEAVAPSLASPNEDVRTIQLYRGQDERNLPVTSLQGGEPLTLEFDLMVEEGRPLTISFQHADRTWRRDLTASKVMESFQDDSLVEYRPSQGTEVPYVHYTYRFPNDEIRFRMSGNYVLRVTERGQRDSVLFEQPFFITEEVGSLRLGAESFVVPNQRQASIQPEARYSPPAELHGDPFGYAVCFVRNGRLPDTRCQERPRLVDQPALTFELQRGQAFAPTTADYGLDLGALETASQIERTDRTVSPIRVLLTPDYADFGEDFGGETLNGQIVVRDAVHNRADPALSAEYVQTTFAFVPSEGESYAGEVTVAGSFSGMNSARGARMEWVSVRDRYEGTVLLKQGQYQYFYASSDPALQQEVRRSRPMAASRYTAFVYYRDASRNTDRLLRVSALSP